MKLLILFVESSSSLKKRPSKLHYLEDKKQRYIHIEHKKDEYTYESGVDSFAIPKILSETQKKILRSYYQNTYIYLKLQVINSLSTIAARLILLIMLFNATNKEDIFGIFYLVGSCVIWRINNFNIEVVTKITNFTIILLLLQYSLLVLNINNTISPLAIPNDIQNTSIIAYIYGSKIIEENQLLKALGIGSVHFQHNLIKFEGFKFSQTRSLIGDCVTFLSLQLFIWSFVLKAEYIFNLLRKRNKDKESKNVENMEVQKKDNIWRSPSYRYLKVSIRFLTLHSPRIIVLILSSIALMNASLSNLILAAIFLLDIILIDFGLFKANIERKIKFMLALFKISQTCIIIFFSLVVANNLPINISPFFSFNSFILDKIFIFIILQLHSDLIQAEDFINAYQRNMLKSSLRVRFLNSLY